MKIQLKLERNGGTIVPMDTKTYHFKPTDADKRHIDDVTDTAHIRRFLSITEAYVTADGSTPDITPPALLSSSSFPPDVEIGGKLIPLSDIVNEAFEVTGLSIEDWNALSIEERDAEIQDEIDLRKGNLLEPDEKEEVALMGKDWEPEFVTVGDSQVSTSDIVDLAFKTSGLSIEDWNAQTKEAAGEFMLAEINKLQEAAKTPEVKQEPVITDAKEIPLLERKPQVAEESMSPATKRKITLANKQLAKDQEAARKAAQ